MSCPLCGEDFCKLDFRPKHEREKAEREWAEDKRRLSRYDEVVRLLRDSLPGADSVSFALTDRIEAFLADEPAPEPPAAEESVETLEDQMRDINDDIYGDLIG